jgi:hypothetical protein
MGTKVLSTFDRLALESAVREHPGDQTAQVAFRDALMEAGMTLLGAKRTVTRIVREACEQRQVERVALFLLGNSPAGELVKRRIIEYAAIRFDRSFAIRVVPGGGRPDLDGDPRDYLTPSGQRYTRSTLDQMPWVEAFYSPVVRQITVGAAWVVTACELEVPELSGR